jgi:hypothetical protein
MAIKKKKEKKGQAPICRKQKIEQHEQEMRVSIQLPDSLVLFLGWRASNKLDPH